ncbi:hypothetical protein BD626DRAFT_149638 [Schizophyllum amplum]|uniref:Uncharacterized protein n=1 Tax=Schizophyllum amplum TaxID=97359 RepID=A0A550C3Y0_9AGAR|nr:hypothetical protein BD626DRAFT_149638 [Auriculariopsis ampla]
MVEGWHLDVPSPTEVHQCCHDRDEGVGPSKQQEESASMAWHASEGLDLGRQRRASSYDGHHGMWRIPWTLHFDFSFEFQGSTTTATFDSDNDKDDFRQATTTKFDNDDFRQRHDEEIRQRQRRANLTTATASEICPGMHQRPRAEECNPERRRR